MNILSHLQESDSMTNQAKICCINNNQALDCCLYSHCQKYAFMCHSNKCPCRKQHLQCEGLERTVKIISRIKKQKRSTKDLEDQIQKMIDKSINDLSDLRDRLISDIRQRCSFVGFSKQEISLVQKIESGNPSNILGKNLWNLWNKMKYKESKKDKIQQYGNKITNILQKFTDSIKQVELSLFSEQLNINNNKNHALITIFTKSKVVKNILNIQNIKGFFSDKKIKSTKLVYRASQNGFLASKFHEKCDNIPHTLTLVETEYGKIIGGYTPIIWNKANNGYATDPQKRSFIFSLTNNQKLIKNPIYYTECQIDCRCDSGPIFGLGADLLISNKANENNDSYANPSYTYIHENYIFHNQQSWKRFSGATNQSKFKIKQWQVWQLQLSQK